LKPVLFYIGSVPVYSYVVFMNLAFVAALTYAWFEAKRQRLDLVYVAELVLVLYIFGLLGARLLYVIVAWEDFSGEFFKLFKIWKGGLVFYGGLIGAVIAGVAYILLRKLDLWKWTDLMAPAAMISLAVGRTGCLLNGCCYGKTAEGLPWGIVYPPDHPSLKLGMGQAKVHPTPLYSSISALLIFGLLLYLLRRKKRDGQVFWSMVLAYGVARFVIEFYRGDFRGQVPYIGLSTSQFISVMAVMLAAGFLVRLHFKGRYAAASGGVS
jgi:phosphatidylglycerol:prolipoprotein diacylglycerol transferase